jgi:hypothetical protein
MTQCEIMEHFQECSISQRANFHFDAVPKFGARVSPYPPKLKFLERVGGSPNTNNKFSDI